MSYDIEKYAEALEAMANEEHRPYDFRASLTRGSPRETPEEYAQYLHHYASSRRALKQAVEMLRMKPLTLRVVYPANFPNPEEGNDDRQP